MINKMALPKNNFRFALFITLSLLVIIEIGVLFVIQNRTPKPDNNLQDSCDSKLQSVAKLNCWNNLVNQVLTQDNGLDKAFSLISDLYNQDPDFVANCHGFTHIVGERAYSLYSQGASFKLSNKASTCGYGFYHGFMEVWLSKRGTLSNAGQFCDWAGKQVGGSNDVKGACFHGIGHGLTQYDNYKLSWANEHELVDKPLQTCEQVTSDELMINRCASGVFNVMAITYSSGTLHLNSDNPLSFCKSLTKDYFKKPCFEEMNTELISLTKGDIIKAASFFNGVEDEYANSGIRSLGTVVGSTNHQISFDTQIHDCRQLDKRLELSCIGGFVGGVIEGGKPGDQDIQALSFCNNSSLRDDEQGRCFQEALWLLSLYLPSGKYHNICTNLNDKYKGYCV